MNFTEAIRKSNLAKQEVLKTRTTAESIKAALVEQGADIADVKFDDIAQFIKENSIGVSGPWKRPKEWLTLPKVVAEEPKYTDKMYTDEPEQGERPPRPPKISKPQSLDDNNKIVAQEMSSFISYLGEVGNLSEVTTGMEDGVFNVSANDFAYEMLCKVEENSDNMLLFEGYTNPSSDVPFTELVSFEDGISSFLTDLFIQIDDEEPLNLTKLAKGEISLPTEGKYKDIAIISKEALTLPSPIMPQSSPQSSDDDSDTGMVEGNISDNITYCHIYPISLLISLDYNVFSDDTKMKNGDKQCIVKIWGNGFIRLIPYRTVTKYSNVINNYYVLAIEKANDCILDVTVCDSNIELPLMLDSGGSSPSSLSDSNISTYELTAEPISESVKWFPATLESLLAGFGDFTQKLTLVSSFKVNSVLESIFKDFNGYGYFARCANNIDDERNGIFSLLSLNDFNFYMNLKEIDCSDVNCFNSYIAMTNFLFAVPLEPILDIHSMSAKVRGVENIIFPDFKSGMEDSEYYAIQGDNFFIYPYCFNLNGFKSLRRDAILDLVDKLPNLEDLEIDSDGNFEDNLQPVYIGRNYEENSSKNNNKPVVASLNNFNKVKTQDEPTTYEDFIMDTFRINTDLKLFNGNQEIVKKYLFKQYGLSDNENECLNVRLNLDLTSTTASEGESHFLDKKWFHTILVSPVTFKELTEEDIKLAKDKGWRIVTGLNYPINPLNRMDIIE